MDKAPSTPPPNQEPSLNNDDWDIPSRSENSEDLPLKKMDKDQPFKQMHQRINYDVSQLLQRFENILAVASSDNSSHTATAVEANQLEVETDGLIRAAEDILSLTRTMKEAWYYGNLDTLGENEQDVQRRKKLEEDVQAVEKAVEKGVLSKLCPEEKKPAQDKDKKQV